MLNYLWAFMMVAGVLWAAFHGNLSAVTDGALSSAKEAVMLCITMLGVMSFWSGIMEIGQKSGLIERLSHRMGPVLRFLFPRIPKDHPAMDHIATNIIANILGLGWAATPAGLKAMESLQELEEERREEEQTGLDKNSLESSKKRQVKKRPRAMPPGTASNVLPKLFTISNYISMNSHFNFMRFFANSIFITLAITVIVIYTSTLCGFVLSKYRFKGRDALFGLVLATMMIPWCVTIIPRYSMIKAFGWMNSYAALIVPASFSGFGIFMMKQHIASVPDEILEAARIDGANEFYIFHKIVIPMAKNGISSIAIFQFLWAWEDFLWPYLVIDDSKKQLLSVGLKMFNGQYSTDYGALFAATTISIIPVLAVYLFFQKQFIAGIAASAVKG